MTERSPDGLRMPAEFEPHRGSWILWPERTDNWRDQAQPAQAATVALARAIVRFEPVTVGVRTAQLANARVALPSAIRVVPLEYDDTWIRDTGPTCVVDDASQLYGLDWQFNSWGGLFATWEKDNDVPRQVLAYEALPRIALQIVLEGGAIHVDGQGTLITTEECLLRPDRNPQLTKTDYERIFHDYLGITRTLWLPQGLYRDETGGHVDNLCAFIEPGVVALAWPDNPSDPQHERSQRALTRLAGEPDAQGRTLRVLKIPQPAPMAISAAESQGFAPSDGRISRKPGDLLAASYINFYVVNGGVIAPVFGDDRDEEALALLKGAFPSREIVPLPAREFLLGGGGLHCLTQQIPLAASPSMRK